MILVNPSKFLQEIAKSCTSSSLPWSVRQIYTILKAPSCRNYVVKQDCSRPPAQELRSEARLAEDQMTKAYILVAILQELYSWRKLQKRAGLSDKRMQFS